MMERIDTFLLERVAQRLVDMLRLNPRGASAMALQVAMLLIGTNLAIDIYWMASTGSLTPYLGMLTVISTAMVCYLVYRHVLTIDVGAGMLPAAMVQRFIILFIAVFNVTMTLFSVLAFRIPAFAQIGNIAEMTGWILAILGVYVRMCRKPPPRKDTRLAHV